jgi:hypothetical protein
MYGALLWRRPAIASAQSAYPPEPGLRDLCCCNKLRRTAGIRFMFTGIGVALASVS